MKNHFETANDAFEYYYDYISDRGEWFAGTRAIFNCGFTLQHPYMRYISSPIRKFNTDYAKAEWEWYLHGNPSIEMLGSIYGKIPAIWKKMADKDGNVNSNYGYQWNRGNQLYKVINMLKDNPETRQATISIYDGKEIDLYATDTPCTYAIQFTIYCGRLNMSVYMRSNDLWYGFCIDQYCFSKLQELVAAQLDIPTGTYYHHAHNMHLYKNKLNEKL